ncbi:MAG TPA: ATP-binding cassette domain-containing protein, partial [Thermoplasmata archaeon]|nr:ATP-binding cassette domain-containing protein [Thermoplasmata archaeon]
MDDVLVEASGLRKYFPIRGGLLRREVGVVRAVDGIDLAIPRGETVGLVGESGCGKTTAGRVLLSLTKSTAGYVFYRFPGLSADEAKEYRHIAEGVRPLPVAIVSLLLAVGGMVCLVAGVLLAGAPWLVTGIAAPFGLFAEYPLAAGAYVAAGGAATVVLAGGLWDMRRWSRPSMIFSLGVFFFVNLFGFPAGIVASVVDGAILAFLWSGPVGTAFHVGHASPVGNGTSGSRTIAVPADAIDVAHL